jgi:ribosome-associated protein
VVTLRGRKETTLSPTARKPRAPKPVPARAAAIAAARALDAVKGEAIEVLDVSEVSPITEYFVLATGTGPRHVKALAEGAVRELRDMGIRAASMDGADEGTWAVVDYGPVVLHVFQATAREFYDLEMLWGDGKKVRWAAAKRKAKADEEE